MQEGVNGLPRDQSVATGSRIGFRATSGPGRVCRASRGSPRRSPDASSRSRRSHRRRDHSLDIAGSDLGCRHQRQLGAAHLASAWDCNRTGFAS